MKIYILYREAINGYYKDVRINLYKTKKEAKKELMKDFKELEQFSEEEIEVNFDGTNNNYICDNFIHYENDDELYCGNIIIRELE